jgi:hypothetical protein
MLERQLDVAVPDKVDERGHRRILGGRADALTDAIAVGDGRLVGPGLRTRHVAHLEDLNA